MACLWSWNPLGAVAPWEVGGNWGISFLRSECSRALTSFFLCVVSARLWTGINAVCLLTSFYFAVTSSMSQPSHSKFLPTQITEIFPPHLNVRRNRVVKWLNNSDNSTSLLYVMPCRLMVTQHLLLSSSGVEKRLLLKTDSRICTKTFRTYILKFYDFAPQKNVLLIQPSQYEISDLTFSHPITDDTKISFPLSSMLIF